MHSNKQLQKPNNTKSTSSKQPAPRSKSLVRDVHPASIMQAAIANPKSLTHTDILQLQRTIGNRAVGQLMSGIGRISSSPVQQEPVQRQGLEDEDLLQGKSIDECIQCQTPEVDDGRLVQGKFTPIQRQDLLEDEEILQGKFETIQRQVPEEMGSTIAPMIQKANKTGLPDNLKAGIENLSGYSMDNVKVHYNSAKPAPLQALAYTQGQEIHVGPGQERHLAHESWHVVQQMQGRVQPTGEVAGIVLNDSRALESEADSMGQKSLQMYSQTELGNDKNSSGIANSFTQNKSSTIQRWCGSEHYMMGTLGSKKALDEVDTDDKQRTLPREFLDGKQTLHHRIGDGNQHVEVDDKTLMIETGDETEISFGEASRVGGDYVKTPDELKGMDEQTDQRGRLRKLIDLGTKSFIGYGSSELVIAATNSNHFYPLNQIEYRDKHRKAVDFASEGNLMDAMRLEGFASHFLQDSFASGHFAPRALDAMASYLGDETEREIRKGKSRTKTWHDFFCMLPDGLPTSMGNFHGDYYMNSNDLNRVSEATKKSLINVLDSYLNRTNNSIEPNIPSPAFGEIMADPVAGPAWKTMIGNKTHAEGYEQDMQWLETHKTDSTYTTSGNVPVKYRRILNHMRQNVFGAGVGDIEVEHTRNNARKLIKAISHYMLADFKVHIYSGLDDEMEQKQPGNIATNELNLEPAFKFDELEDKFKLFSNLNEITSDLVSIDTNVNKAKTWHTKFFNIRKMASNLEQRKKTLSIKYTQLYNFDTGGFDDMDDSFGMGHRFQRINPPMINMEVFYQIKELEKQMANVISNYNSSLDSLKNEIIEIANAVKSRERLEQMMLIRSMTGIGPMLGMGPRLGIGPMMGMGMLFSFILAGGDGGQPQTHELEEPSLD